VLGSLVGTTRIIVLNSQNLESVRLSADRLVLLHEGRIVHNGPPVGVSESALALIGREYKAKLQGTPAASSRTAHLPENLWQIARAHLRHSKHALLSLQHVKDNDTGADSLLRHDSPPKEFCHVAEALHHSEEAPQSDDHGLLHVVFNVCQQAGLWYPALIGATVLQCFGEPLALWWNSQWVADTFGLGPVGCFLTAIGVASLVLILTLVSDACSAKAQQTYALNYYREIERKCEHVAMAYTWEKHGSSSDLQAFADSDPVVSFLDFP
jgi:hypothetical protein